MNAIKNMKPTNEVKPYVVSREFNAPRDLVWEANTSAAHMEKWLGSEETVGHTQSMDFREGGSYHYAQRSPNGTLSMWGRMTYLRIEPKHHMEVLNNFSDEKGNITSHPMAPTWPKLMHWDMRFEELGQARSRLTITWLPVEGSSAEELAMFDTARSGMDQGWKNTFDKLETYLATVIV
ncbi:MAG: SRPBCC family protein [Flavobacteriales bacterium]